MPVDTLVPIFRSIEKKKPKTYFPPKSLSHIAHDRSHGRICLWKGDPGYRPGQVLEVMVGNSGLLKHRLKSLYLLDDSNISSGLEKTPLYSDVAITLSFSEFCCKCHREDNVLLWGGSDMHCRSFQKDKADASGIALVETGHEKTSYAPSSLPLFMYRYLFICLTNT